MCLAMITGGMVPNTQCLNLLNLCLSCFSNFGSETLTFSSSDSTHARKVLARACWKCLESKDVANTSNVFFELFLSQLAHGVVFLMFATYCLCFTATASEEGQGTVKNGVGDCWESFAHRIFPSEIPLFPKVTWVNLRLPMKSRPPSMTFLTFPFTPSPLWPPRPRFTLLLLIWRKLSKAKPKERPGQGRSGKVRPRMRRKPRSTMRTSGDYKEVTRLMENCLPLILHWILARGTQDTCKVISRCL